MIDYREGYFADIQLRLEKLAAEGSRAEKSARAGKAKAKK